MDKITKFRIKKPDNTLSEEIPISTTVQHVIYNQNQNLDDVLGVVDIDNKGDIQYQLDELNDKIDQASFELTDEAKEMVVNAVLEVYPKAAQGDFITAQDEGKVVQNRKLVPQTKLKVSENGTYTTTLNNRVQVEVYPNLQSKYVTVNGIVTPDSGYDGLSDVEVDVSLQSLLQSKIVTQNGIVVADTGYEGLSEVTVDVQPLLQDKTITSNGTFYPDNGYEGFKNVEVDVDVEEAIIMPFNVIQNGFYGLERDIDGFSIVTADVDNTYFDQDEKKVVKNSKLEEQDSLTDTNAITENGTLDTTYIGTLEIKVPGGNDVLGPTKITENGTFVPETGVTGFNSVEVKVPNSYGVADEGKVVYNKKLINQISKTVTKNGVYNITTNNQVIVNVKGGTGSADNEGKPNTTPGSPSPSGAGSAVVGTDPTTGNDVVVGVDENDNLVKTPVPSGIEIVTEPTKTSYVYQETMDYTGIVVAAKKKDGTTFTDSRYTNGYIPMQELIFPVDKAPAGGGPSSGSSVHTDLGDLLFVAAGQEYLDPSSTGTGLREKRTLSCDADGYFFQSSEDRIIFQTKIQGAYASFWNGPAGSGAGTYANSESGGWYYLSIRSNYLFAFTGIPAITGRDVPVVDIPDTSKVAIPVKWNNPYTGSEHQDTFEITSTSASGDAHTSTSSNGTEGSGGGGSF